METSASTNRPAGPEQKTSALFCALDADVIFISSDKVVFKIHSAYLTLMTSTGFAKVSAETLVGSESVQLPETSNVLEILFQFIEPPDETRNYRQPSVMGLNPAVFFGVAEAAEKYVVYGAMNVCVTRMQQIVSQHPLEVLNHCAKHGYDEVADQAAEYSISHPLPLIAAKLTAPGLLPRWLVYYCKWRDAAIYAARRLEHFAPKDCCIWILYYHQVNEIPSIERINLVPRLSGK